MQVRGSSKLASAFGCDNICKTVYKIKYLPKAVDGLLVQFQNIYHGLTNYRPRFWGKYNTAKRGGVASSIKVWSCLVILLTTSKFVWIYGLQCMHWHCKYTLLFLSVHSHVLLFTMIHTYVKLPAIRVLRTFIRSTIPLDLPIVLGLLALCNVFGRTFQKIWKGQSQNRK